MSFVVWWLVLNAVTKPVDDAGNVAGADIAPSSNEWDPGTRDPDETTFDQLHCVQRAEQALGAVDTLVTAHGAQAGLDVAVAPFAAVGRDHPVVEAGRRVLGVGCPGANGGWIERGFVGDYVHRRAFGRVDGAS